MTGILSKFSNGGGEDIVHSRVVPPHGFIGAFEPRLKALIKFPNISNIPDIIIQEPIVAMR